MTGSHDYIRHFFRDFEQDGLGRWKAKCDQKQYAMDLQYGGDCDGGHKTDPVSYTQLDVYKRQVHRHWRGRSGTGDSV